VTVTYHVIPFCAKIREGSPEGAISSQLQAVIESEVAKGYELVQVASVPTVVTPGCLAFLAKPQTTFSTQIIFRKP
jgi:hypothetical protein